MRARLSLGCCVLVAAAVALLGLVGSSSAAGNAPFIAGAPGAPAQADCSHATANGLVNQARINYFGLQNPVQQTLCGAFTGEGSHAMAVTIAAPTCWGIQHWAVFDFKGGSWRLVMDQPAYLLPPLRAVDDKIKETVAVHRPGDPRCFPSGGKRSRVWSWNGSKLVPGPWEQELEWPALPSARVTLDSVSNGCGPGEASSDDRFADTATFGHYTVSFRTPCNLHDAGYSGALVRDPLRGVTVDFFTWTRARVDSRFLSDMVLVCGRVIPANDAEPLLGCRQRARRFFNFVNEHGARFFAARPKLAGLWSVKGGGSPGWRLTHEIATRTVTAIWKGGLSRPGLSGEFRGRLITRDQDSIVKGSTQITENGQTRAGPMTFTYRPSNVAADELVVSGSGMSVTLFH
jgi:hypothetical protein